MAAPAGALLTELRTHALLDEAHLAEAEALLPAFPDEAALGLEVIRRGWMTRWQVERVVLGESSQLAVGPYVLLGRLGQGGMGCVYRARHRLLAQERALKVVTGGDAARFLREMRVGARLNHPNVVRVEDAGEHQGRPYLAMELLRGTDLLAHVQYGGPQEPGQACEWVRQAALGLQAVHDAGLVHRDVKPANLMLCAGGLVKVLDLGLVRVSAGDALTRSNAAMGTPDYMAPEQVMNSRDVDGRADVYSLGCTLYHLLAGDVPFSQYHPAARCGLHLTQEPTRLEGVRSGLPTGLGHVVRAMMAKRPEGRLATPEAVAAALAPFITGRFPAESRVSVPAGLVDSVTGTFGVPPTLPGPPKASGGLVVNSLGMKFALIPPGAFWMGSPDDEADRSAYEGPRHEVEISRPFYLGVCAVTQSDYKRVMGTNPSHFKLGDRYPVEMVSWEEAVAFCWRLSGLAEEQAANRLYRLPTEAEWEYACRGPGAATEPFHFGWSLCAAQANFDGRYPYGGAPKGEYRQRTVPVEEFAPNRYGLHQMHGNVWEWCQDWYDKDYYTRSSRRDPAGPPEGSCRVVRGGGWYFLGRRCRSAYRNWRLPTDRRNYLGFRVVLVSPGE